MDKKTRKKKTQPAEPEPLQELRPREHVLITGAGGYVGRLLVKALSKEPGALKTIVAMDIRSPEPSERLDGITYITQDICDPTLGELLNTHQIDTVVHLASIVTPPKGCTRERQYEVDVIGTENLLAACFEHGVQKFIVTSSGAAYGYHPDNAPLLTEDQPLRGNDAFAYACHKRIIEEKLAELREKQPELQQLVFRPGTILGASVSNQITDIFEKPVITGIQGSTTPFNFIWEEDVVACLMLGIHSEKTGVYNLIGDGVLTLREIASLLKKPYLQLPPALLSGALEQLEKFGLTQYGPEQIDFLRYRPVLSNARLKREFGYRPRKTSREVFAMYQERRHPQSLLQNTNPLSRWWSTQTEQKQRVVVITGAAGGIGTALAERFAKNGDKIALLDIDEDALRTSTRTFKRHGVEVLGFCCDVTQPLSCQQTIDQIIENWGGIDILINNAGISHRSLLSDTSPEVLHKVMEINFFGAVHCTQAALQSICQRKGMIVALSSVAGFAPLVGRTGYAASKHALHGFFDSLRVEIEDSGASVLLVCPSFIKTDIETHALSGNGAQLGQSQRDVAGDVAMPADVADEIFSAIQRKEKLLLSSSTAKASFLLSRTFPALYSRVMRSRQGSEFGL